jgi:hypothetical protein
MIFEENFKSLHDIFELIIIKNEYGISRCYPSFFEGEIISKLNRVTTLTWFNLLSIIRIISQFSS